MLLVSTVFVCSDCLTVEWCQLAWGTMEIRFVYFLILKWTLHLACFNQHSNDTNLHSRGQTNIIKKNLFQCHILNNSPIRPSKSLLKSPSGEGNNFRPCLTWFERHNLIGWFCCQKSFHWLTQSTGLNNSVLSESTESSDNVQLTICTSVLW